MSAPRLALQRKEAAEALGVSGDTFDRHIRPELRCVYVGDLRLWPVAELERWLDRTAADPVPSIGSKKRRGAGATAPGMAQEV